MKTNRLIFISSLAQLIGQLNPAAWDAIHPHQPFTYSDAHIDLLAADLVRQISVALADKTLSHQVFSLSQQMARTATAALAATWDEPGDELCPSIPFPFPHGHSYYRELAAVASPPPEPWASIGSAEQVQLAYGLAQAASLTTDAVASKSLLRLATSVASAASRTLADDFERCGNRPRPKFPKKTVGRQLQPA